MFALDEVFQELPQGREFTAADARAGVGTHCCDGENSKAYEASALAGMFLSWHSPPKNFRMLLSFWVCMGTGGCPVGVSHSSAKTWEQQAANPAFSAGTSDSQGMRHLPVQGAAATSPFFAKN